MFNQYRQTSSNTGPQAALPAPLHSNDHVQRAALERRAAAICTALGLRPRVLLRAAPSAKRHWNANRAEQHARYIDCGSQAWDDRDSESGDH